jgi:hypothetical protein
MKKNEDFVCDKFLNMIIPDLSKEDKVGSKDIFIAILIRKQAIDHEFKLDLERESVEEKLIDAGPKRHINVWLKKIWDLYDHEKLGNKLDTEHLLFGLAFFDEHFKSFLLESGLYEQLRNEIEKPILFYLSRQYFDDDVQEKAEPMNEKMFNVGNEIYEKMKEIKAHWKLKSENEALILSVRIASRIQSELNQNKKLLLRDKKGTLYELVID